MGVGQEQDREQGIGVPASPSGSRKSSRQAVSPAGAASIPNAVSEREIKRGIERLQKIRYRHPSEAIALLLELHEHLERALRIRIWNECRSKGMSDGDCYRSIKTAVGEIHAQAIEARRAATTGAVEDESAVPKGGATPEPPTPGSLS